MDILGVEPVHCSTAETAVLQPMMQLQPLLSAIIARRKQLPAERSVLVGISGIDGSGKGFLARRLADSLGEKVAVLGVDGWLNLPQVRFAPENRGENFYRRALRLDEMFSHLVLPLRDRRSVDVEMDFTEETASCHQKHRYRFCDIDVILLEGIFLFQPRYRHHFDLTCWVDCSFETALARAVQRCQEGLPPEETVRAFETIYFPAQRIHLHRDRPRETADFVLPNDADEPAAASNLLPKPWPLE